MIIRSLVVVTALAAASALAGAAEPTFRLGVDSARQFDSVPAADGFDLAIATDRAGALYVLGYTTDGSRLPATSLLGASAEGPTSYVLKIAPSGDRIEYLAVLGFYASKLAVDPAGNAYVASDSIVKINASGTAIVYRVPLPAPGAIVRGMAVDSTGRVYIAGHVRGAPFEGTWNAFQRTAPDLDSTNVFVARINAVWNTFDWLTYLAGQGWEYATGIAVDEQGTVFVTGTTNSLEWPLTPGAYLTARAAGALWDLPFLTRLSPDGSRLLYSTFLSDTMDWPQLAVDPGGSASVLLTARPWSARLLRFTPSGTLRSEPANVPDARLAVDSEGRTYVSGYTSSASLPHIRNSVQPCGTEPPNAFLLVIGPDGATLQGTWLPSAGVPAVTSSGQVSLIDRRFGTPGTEPVLQVLRLSRRTEGPTVKLGCLSSAAQDVAAARVAPGEAVSLFGESLGPSPELDGVRVTFNGLPAPLLYASERQINAVVPFGVTEGTPVEICAFVAENRTNCLTRQVVAAEPRVFLSGPDYAAAFNEDGSRNSADNPAAPNSVVSIFATGLGRVVPTPVDGSVNGTSAAGVNAVRTQVAVITVTYGFLFSATSIAVTDPEFVGPAPGQVAGISLVRLRATAKQMQLYSGEGKDRVESNYFRIYVRQ